MVAPTNYDYVEKPYDHRLFDSLNPLEITHTSFEKADIPKESIAELRDIFTRHGVQNTIGLHFLHRHFDLAENERAVEYGRITTAWPVSGLNPIGGTLIPRSFRLHDGSVYPLEFGFQPRSATEANTYVKFEFTREFIRDFWSWLRREGVENVFGLFVLDNERATNLKGLRIGGKNNTIGVERTIGRVSMMVPVDEDERIEREKMIEEQQSTVQQDLKRNKLGKLHLDEGYEEVEEVSWMFGCPTSMDDSGIMAARICWVCTPDCAAGACPTGC